jgi:hypothetical protein
LPPPILTTIGTFQHRHCLGKKTALGLGKKDRIGGEACPGLRDS